MDTPKPFVWVAFPSVAGGYDKVIEDCLRRGFGGIAPRAGEGRPDGSFSWSLDLAVVRKIVDAGLECSPWVFSRPQALAFQVIAYKKLQDAGATRLIDDAETPWDVYPSARDAAKRYGDMYRTTVSLPAYDAPWPAIDYHPGYPHAEFGAWVTGRMPQCYWTEVGWSARKTLDVCAAQWRGKDSRILPIGITYGREEMRKWGQKQLPPGSISVAEVESVVAECTGGWYSAEAAGPGVLDAVSVALHPHLPPPTQPESDPLPIGWADRAEAAAAEDFYRRNSDTHAQYALLERA